MSIELNKIYLSNNLELLIRNNDKTVNLILECKNNDNRKVF